MKYLWKLIEKWVAIFAISFFSLVHVVTNPSFIFFTIIALGLSTMGIWIEIFPNNISENMELIDQLDNVSVFTFSIATLGSMATAYFFESKNLEGQNLEGYGYPQWLINVFNTDVDLLRNSIFFAWAFALFLAFHALENQEGIIPCLVSTLFVWVVDNLRRPIFRKINDRARDNLNPIYSSFENDQPENEMSGDGL